MRRPRDHEREREPALLPDRERPDRPGLVARRDEPEAGERHLLGPPLAEHALVERGAARHPGRRSARPARAAAPAAPCAGARRRGRRRCVPASTPSSVDLPAPFAPVTSSRVSGATCSASSSSRPSTDDVRQLQQQAGCLLERVRARRDARERERRRRLAHLLALERLEPVLGVAHAPRHRLLDVPALEVLEELVVVGRGAPVRHVARGLGHTEPRSRRSSSCSSSYCRRQRSRSSAFTARNSLNPPPKTVPPDAASTSSRDVPASAPDAGERQRAPAARVEVEQPGRHAVEELAIVAREEHRPAPGAQPLLEERTPRRRRGGSSARRAAARRARAAAAPRARTGCAGRPRPRRSGGRARARRRRARRAARRGASLGRPDVGAFGRVERRPSTGRRMPRRRARRRRRPRAPPRPRRARARSPAPRRARPRARRRRGRRGGTGSSCARSPVRAGA